jgi:hypothetical protein
MLYRRQALGMLRKRVAGLTPVQIAERSRYHAAVELLLKGGANDNRGPRDFLIGACARGDRAGAERVLAANPPMPRLLLDRGANLEASHMYGGNALGTAMIAHGGESPVEPARAPPTGGC